MPLRMFRDEVGREWRVWEVRPTRPERRDGDRRCGACDVPVDRRRGDDRRRRAEMRVRLTNGLALGWLAFVSDAEKRRLAPIPHDWDGLPDGELCALCQHARPSDRRG